MKNILVIGAGRSSSTMIKYFLDHSNEQQWKVRVGDMDLATAKEKVSGHQMEKRLFLMH